MNSDTLHRLAQSATEAIHAPAFKLSAGASVVATGASTVGEKASIAEWFASGPGMVALASLTMTLLTLIVGAWAAWRKDKREQMLTEAKLRAIEHSGADTDPMPLDPAPRASRKKPRPD